jgi:hypothetical protein
MQFTTCSGGLCARFAGFNKFWNYSSMENLVDQVNDAMDRRGGRVHGGPRAARTVGVVAPRRRMAREC